MAEAKKEKKAEAAPSASVGYETFDGNEALKFNQAGGRLVAITKRYPNHPFKPGKRYVFLESKAQLDALLAKSEEEGA